MGVNSGEAIFRLQETRISSLLKIFEKRYSAFELLNLDDFGRIGEVQDSNLRTWDSALAPAADPAPHVLSKDSLPDTRSYGSLYLAISPDLS